MCAEESNGSSKHMKINRRIIYSAPKVSSIENLKSPSGYATAFDFSFVLFTGLERR